MALPNSYTVKYGSLAAYFNAIHTAEPPDRFSVKFLETLEFKSMNDRALIGILRELGFLDIHNVPTKRYYEYLDQEAGPRVLAESIRAMFSDLFAVTQDAYKMTPDQAYDKLRTLYAGTKKDNLIKLIAKTFIGLCKLTDFEYFKLEKIKKPTRMEANGRRNRERKSSDGPSVDGAYKRVKLKGSQYHVNIILPETRDQAVYDVIFKSLSEHFE